MANVTRSKRRQTPLRVRQTVHPGVPPPCVVQYHTRLAPSTGHAKTEEVGEQKEMSSETANCPANDDDDDDNASLWWRITRFSRGNKIRIKKIHHSPSPLFPMTIRRPDCYCIRRTEDALYFSVESAVCERVSQKKKLKQNA